MNLVGGRREQQNGIFPSRAALFSKLASLILNNNNNRGDDSTTSDIPQAPVRTVSDPLADGRVEAVLWVPMRIQRSQFRLPFFCVAMAVVFSMNT